MLVLSRRIGEWLQFDTPAGPIRLKVTKWHTNPSGSLTGVRMAIDAPLAIRIRRGELVERDAAAGVISPLDMAVQEAIASRHDDPEAA